MDTQLRAAIFEDDVILSGVLEDVMNLLGFEVIACVCSLPRAIQTASAELFDLAVVDINLRGQEAYSLLDVLNARGIPFVIATGSDLADIKPPYDREVIVWKPYSVAALQDALDTLSDRAKLAVEPRLKTNGHRSHAARI